VFFIATPLIGLLIISYIFNLEFLDGTIKAGMKDKVRPLSGVIIGGLIYAHLFIVFFRSHGNRKIFKLYPYRFTLVPIVLAALINSSLFFGVLILILASWWDVYHSSLQTFGLGRIYDKKAGNANMNIGRRLDYFLNLSLYVGPIFAGWALMPHMKVFNGYEQINDQSFLIQIPDLVFQYKSNITEFVFLIGLPFLIFYLYSYWRFYKAGYAISFQKIALLTCTAICSISAWGFNSFGQAFVIMNFFHAIQYFAIVWHFEKKNMQKSFGQEGKKRGVINTFLIFILIGISAGYFLETNMFYYESIFAVALTVSIMHFWYDSFIWSVRKSQV
ncbi:MAG: hypothetical protein ACI9SC_000035, partial [Gammaproteobacteria bacterium]